MILFLYTGPSALIIYISNIHRTQKYIAVMYYFMNIPDVTFLCRLWHIVFLVPDGIKLHFFVWTDGFNLSNFGIIKKIKMYSFFIINKKVFWWYKDVNLVNVLGGDTRACSRQATFDIGPRWFMFGNPITPNTKYNSCSR